MTSRIQGWSNRQKDTGWGYAVAHLIPVVWIYYSITRRTISNATNVLGASILINIIVVFIASNQFHWPSLFYEAPVDENTSLLIVLLETLITPFSAKFGISEARKDGKRRLKNIKEKVDDIKLKEVKGELEQLKDEVRKLKREK